MSVLHWRGEETDKCCAIIEADRQWDWKRQKERKGGYMKAVDILTALNYRADYSGRMAPGLFLWLTFTKWQSVQADMHKCEQNTHLPIQKHTLYTVYAHVGRKKREKLFWRQHRNNIRLKMEKWFHHINNILVFLDQRRAESFTKAVAQR